MEDELLLMTACSEVACGSGHGLATDIFSLGSVLYTMLVGGPPFESSDLLETINRIKAVLYKMPNLLSAKAQHLIMSVMRLSPDDRLTLNGLCSSSSVLHYCDFSCISVVLLCSNLHCDELSYVYVLEIRDHPFLVGSSLEEFQSKYPGKTVCKVLCCLLSDGCCYWGLLFRKFRC